ncbi:disintegrin and metalloproteinase domain-containing protein 10 isoform X2 [Hydra vulgaris]|uniref:Disintegrin and metalloproteinase domain-containing protein 10 isoform X2 n=1 Tax=Hydra vulgaris TaxID=6087 RepID=A0ABM4BCI3_HYDVU
MFSSRFIEIVLLFIIVNKCSAKQPLNSFIRHHEKITYDTEDVHRRSRRALELSPYANVHLKFNAFNRNFTLHMRRNHEIFASDFKIVDGLGNKIDYDYSRFFQGEVEGFHQGKSHVLGKIDDGRFEGKIHLGKDEYYIEPAEKYFNDENDSSFHSVMYNLNDVEHESKFVNPPIPSRPTSFEGNGLENKIKEELDKGKQRFRRGTKNRRMNTCNLKLVADHLFMRKYVRRQQAIDQMVLHYQAVEYIFRNQTFNTTDQLDSSYSPEGIGFRIKEVHVWLENTVPPEIKPTFVTAYELLEQFSRMNHSSVCLAYLFTDRSFEDGVLGLSWIAYQYGQPGGICDPYANYGGIWKTYNTGLVTVRLYNREAPMAITEISFAHELGHSFGAQHDPANKDCQPGIGRGGNFIMYDKATSGYLKNNKLFSRCSIARMIPVINAKGLEPTVGCFTDRYWAICGNGAFEEGEICDCGTESTCVEKCCTPYGAKYGTPCTFRNPAYQCSPSKGPCCLNETCTIARQYLQCFDGTECMESLVCNGLHYTCPLPKFKANLTLCDKERSVCINGFCQGSLCLRYGLEGCMCDAPQDKCKVCCQYNGKCTSSYNIDFMPNKTLSRGMPCNYYKGYCNSQAVCEDIDMDGPMRMLYATFFTEEGIKFWFRRYWFVIILASLLILCVLTAFVYYCQSFTPSDNPYIENKKVHKPLTKKRRQAQGADRYQAGGGKPIPMSSTYA